MTTALDLCTHALVDARAFGAGETIPSDDATFALSKLNSMMESWSIERMMVHHLLLESKALTASVGSFTIGSGGTFNTTRPTKIVDPCFVRDSDGGDHHVMVIDAPSYGAIDLKTLDGAYPQYLYYDNADTAGLGTIYLYPEPDSGLTLYISSWKQLQSFASLSTSLVLPPGYQLAIESNLSILLCPSYGKRPTPELAEIARNSKANVKRVNAPIGVMGMPLGVPGIGMRSNILSG